MIIIINDNQGGGMIIKINNYQGGRMILECVVSRLSAPPKTLHWLKGGQVGHHHRQHQHHHRQSHHCYNKKKFKDAMLISINVKPDKKYL